MSSADTLTAWVDAGEIAQPVTCGSGEDGAIRDHAPGRPQATDSEESGGEGGSLEGDETRSGDLVAGDDGEQRRCMRHQELQDENGANERQKDHDDCRQRGRELSVKREREEHGTGA